METSFRAWLRKRDPELAESVLGRLGAVMTPMITTTLGGAAGLLASPVIAPPGGVTLGAMIGSGIGQRLAHRWFPQGTEEAMRKQMRKRMRRI